MSQRSDRDGDRERSRARRLPSAARPLDSATGGLGSVTRWTSRYCPECGAPGAAVDDTCVDCGEPLRERTVSRLSPMDATTGYGEATGFDEDLLHCANPRCRAIVCPGLDVCPRCETPLLAAEAEASGRVLGGRWRLGAKVGESTFARFYEARHTVLSMRVGVKALRRRFVSTQAGRRLFYEEAQNLSNLTHPNVVRVLDFGDEDGASPFLVMELLSGDTLVEVIRRGHLVQAPRPGRHTLRDGVEILRQVAVALIEAHTANQYREPIVHLDLKPEHVFVEKARGEDRWRVKVIDFGIAQILSSPGSPPGAEGVDTLRSVAGTRPYMAPERFDGVVDPRCDIYALGVILYELLAGRRPFSAPDDATWRRVLAEQEPSPPSRFRSDNRTRAIRTLEDIALACLRKHPAERPQSAVELVRRLDEWSARFAAPPEPMRRRVQRVVGPSAALVALLAAVLYWGPYEDVRTPWSAGEIQRIGLDTEVSIGAATVRGFGYEGAPAELEVQAAGRVGRVPLGSVDSAGIVDVRASWPDVARALSTGEGPPNGEAVESVEARFLVRGAWGRTLRSSDALVLEVDGVRPRLDLVLSNARFSESSRDLIWLDERSDRRLEFRCDRPLDLERSRWWWIDEEEGAPTDGGGLAARGLVSGGSDREVLLDLSVPRSRRLRGRVRAELVDTVGNENVLEWSVRGYMLPQLTSNRLLRSHSAVCQVPIVFDRQLTVSADVEERLEVTLDGRGVEPEPTGEGTYSVSVAASLGEGAFETRTLRILVDTPFERVEELVRVELHRRPLELLGGEIAVDGSVEPYRVVDARTGAEVSEIDRWVTHVSVATGGDEGREARPSFRVDPETRRLVASVRDGEVAEPADLSASGGRVKVVVVATDVFGNVATADWERTFDVLDADDVRIEVVRGAPGSSEEPLLPPDCPLAEALEPSGLSRMQEVRLRLRTSFSFPLEWEASIRGGARPLGRGECTAASDAEIVVLVPTSELSVASAEATTLRVRMWEQGTLGESSVVKHIRLNIAPRLELATALLGGNEETGEVFTERAQLEIAVDPSHSARGLSLRVDGIEQDSVRTLAVGRRWRADVPVSARGTTHVTALVRFDSSGASVDVPAGEWRLWRAPVPGETYVFEALDGVGSMAIGFTGKAGWVVSPDECARLLREFRHGERSAPRPLADALARHGEVEAFRAWLERRFGLRTELPTRTFFQDEGLPIPVAEWVRFDAKDPECDGLDDWRSIYVTRGDKLVSAWGNEDESTRCAFRLRVDEAGSSTRLDPRRARRE